MHLETPSFLIDEDYFIIINGHNNLIIFTEKMTCIKNSLLYIIFKNPGHLTYNPRWEVNNQNVIIYGFNTKEEQDHAACMLILSNSFKSVRKR